MSIHNIFYLVVTRKYLSINHSFEFLEVVRQSVLSIDLHQFPILAHVDSQDIWLFNFSAVPTIDPYSAQPSSKSHL